MATVTSPRTAAPTRTRTPSRGSAPTRPARRVSGPARGRAAAAPATAPRESLALGPRALALVRGLPDHSVIDRLVRGRAWIPVLGVLLAGIVTMQVEILKLGSSMGRSVEQASTLQTQNEALQASVATLADDQRIERIAATKGMVMPAADALVFLRAQPARAVGNLHAPDPTAFASQLAAQAAAEAALMPAAPTPSGTTATGTSSTSTGAAGTATSTAPATSSAPANSTPASSAPATGTPAAGSATPPSVTPSAVPATGAAGIAPAAPTQTSGG